MLFAEADPLAGWFQVVLQGGSFGLLCVIIVYIWPKSQKDAREEREKRDVVLERVVTSLQVGFEARNLMLVNAIERQTAVLTEKMNEEMGTISGAMQDVCKAADVPRKRGEH